MISNVFPFVRLFAAKGNEIQAAMASFVASPSVEPNVFDGTARPFAYIGRLTNTFDSSPTLSVDVPALAEGAKYQVMAIGSYSKLTRDGTAITPTSANSAYEQVGFKGGNEVFYLGFSMVVDELNDSYSGESVDYVSVRKSVGFIDSLYGGKLGAFSEVIFYGRVIEA